ncbi:MAG: hypothetical protein DHS20C16_09140 [Phycisphaerae bacterium]|nr:MAG: hypothetical protein DHS20C16_09140 [Phycisphaerae bacterium]
MSGGSVGLVWRCGVVILARVESVGLCHPDTRFVKYVCMSSGSKTLPESAQEAGKNSIHSAIDSSP